MADKYTIDYAGIGGKIKEKRESLKLSQAAAAEKSNLSVGFFGNVERGVKTPSVANLIQIVNALDLDLNYLFLDFLPDSSDTEYLQTAFKSIFDGKTPEETDYLINLLKMLSKNIDTLRS